MFQYHEKLIPLAVKRLKECKKYYKPLRSDATINSHIIYERIMCYPIHGGVSDL